MARIREVYPTREIPHKWVYCSPAHARNPQGNLHYSGDTITSYRTPIARIYSHKKRGRLVLISKRRYSNTTARQLSMIWYATRHLPHIFVPEPCPLSYEVKDAHAKNLAHLMGVAADSLARARRMQTARNVEWERKEAAHALDNARLYCAFFGIRRKVPALPAAEWDAARARAERIENPTPEDLARRERNAAARAAREEITGTPTEVKRQAQYAARRLREIERECGEHERARFIATGCARTAWRLGIEGPQSRYNDGAIMLRVLGDQIETSQGARIPLAAAPMIWHLVERTRKAGGRNFGETLQKGGYKIGDYPLDRIDAEGTLYAGCHVIPHSELRAMARQLGLAS